MYLNELYIKQMIENGEITLEEIKNLIKVSLEKYPELKSIFKPKKKVWVNERIFFLTTND